MHLRTAKTAWKKSTHARNRRQDRPRVPQGGRRGRETETARKLCKQALSSPWLRGHGAGVYIRHSPAPAFVCWSNRVHLQNLFPFSRPLKQIQANWKTAADLRRARAHNHSKFRPEKTG